VKGRSGGGQKRNRAAAHVAPAPALPSYPRFTSLLRRTPTYRLRQPPTERAIALGAAGAGPRPFCTPPLACFQSPASVHPSFRE
jgi:hypothetical protein